MTLANVLLTLATVVAIAVGQVLFKLGALASLSGDGDSSAIGRYANGYLLTALLVYVLATGLWVWVLKTVPLSVAYPFMGLAFVMVPLLAMAFLGEPIGARHLIGGVVIGAGIWIVHSA